jgi:hypothetical protein
MMSTPLSKDALARMIERGEYVVDVHAVAEAMLRDGGFSGVLVAPQALDRAPVRVEHDDAASREDVA